MYRLTKIFLTCLVCSTLALQALGVAPATAAGATLYLSPSSGSVANGSNLVVKVYEDSGSTQVNAVQANLTYPTNLLSYVSYASSSAFSIEAENPSSNSGSLRFARGSITARTGAQLVVTITFRAVASSGTANVSFSSGSSVNAADGSGTNILSGTNGGKYTLSKAAATSSGSSGSTSSAAKGDKTPPKISDIKASIVTDTSALITWKSSEPATSEVSYGEDTKHQISTTDTQLVTDHQITIGFGVLAAGTTYYFKVKSADAAGNKVTSKDLTLCTTGVSPQDDNAQPTASKKGLYLAAGAAAAALLAATAGSALFIKRRRARAELEKHFPDSDNNSNSTPPQPPSSGPTIIYPTGGPRA